MNNTNLEFEKIADQTIEILLELLDEKLGDISDVFIDNDVLNIELDKGDTFIINKNSPKCEIWLSSPNSGAHHFMLDQNLIKLKDSDNNVLNLWIDTRKVNNHLLQQLTHDILLITSIDISK